MVVGEGDDCGGIEHRDGDRTAQRIATGPTVERDAGERWLGGAVGLRVVSDDIPPSADGPATLRAVAVGHQRDAVAVVDVGRPRERRLVVAPEPAGLEGERAHVPVTAVAGDGGEAVPDPEFEGRLGTERTGFGERDGVPVHALDVGARGDTAGHLQAGVGQRVGVRVVALVLREIVAHELPEVVGDPRRRGLALAS